MLSLYNELLLILLLEAFHVNANSIDKSSSESKNFEQLLGNHQRSNRNEETIETAFIHLRSLNRN